MLKLKTITQNPKVNLRDRCYQFSLAVIRFMNDLPDKQIYRILGNQLLRAATSVGANIIEAKSSSSRRDFIKFYQISLKSANETEYWLNLWKDVGLVKSFEAEALLRELIEIERMLGASLLTLKDKR